VDNAAIKLTLLLSIHFDKLSVFNKRLMT
jgi:hypothetical protein